LIVERSGSLLVERSITLLTERSVKKRSTLLVKKGMFCVFKGMCIDSKEKECFSCRKVEFMAREIEGTLC